MADQPKGEQSMVAIQVPRLYHFRLDNSVDPAPMLITRAAPSVISPAWLNGVTSHQHLTILFHGIAKIVEIMWQAVLLGVYGLVSMVLRSWRMTEGALADIRYGLPMAPSTYTPVESHESTQPRSLAGAAQSPGRSRRQ